MDNKNPYALPKPIINNTNDTSCRRDGRYILVPIGSDLPERCIFCNTPVKLPIKSKKFYWHSSVWYLLIPINILLYAVVALLVRKSSELSPGLCDSHMKIRKKRLQILFAIALVAVIFGGFMQEALQGPLALLSFFAAFVALIFANFAAKTIQPREINKAHTKLSGCKEPFLVSLE